MPPRRFVLLGIFLATATVVVLVSRRAAISDNRHIKPILEKLHSDANDPKEKEKEKDVVSAPCEEHLGWLEPYQFTYPIKYVSRDIIAKPRGDEARLGLTVMEEPLFSDFTIINSKESLVAKNSHCLPPLELEVPHGRMMPVNATNMIFGLQTTISRLQDTVKHLARWLPHTGARLFCIVIESEYKKEPGNERSTVVTHAKDNEMAALEKEFRDKGMLVTIVHPLEPKDYFAQRYVSLSKLMYEARDENTQWIVHIDDDTFFPSMYNVQAELKTHDWRKPHYIGALSEDWWAVDHYGLMGFGGAGVFLSLPTAALIAENYAQCKETTTSAGDISVMDCIYKHSSTKLTHLPALHQVDMHGDVSGFYESGREMLSLHHWKAGSDGGHKLEIEKMHLIADICDSCFLQRWQFPNNMLLSNGFSITTYPEGHLTGVKTNLLGNIPGSLGTVEKIDLVYMEETWNDKIKTDHSLAPIRNKLPKEQKLSFKLLDSMPGKDPSIQGQKIVRQVYFKEGSEEGDQDTVIVLNWRSAASAKVGA